MAQGLTAWRKPIVARVGTRVELDDSLLARIDDLARRLGSSREQLIEDSIRREVAARTLEGIFERSRSADDIAEEEATALAYRELDAMRAERDDPSQPA